MHNYYVIILIQHLFLSIECQLALNDSCHSLSNPAFHKTFLGEDSTTDIAIIDVNQHKNKSLNLSLCQIAGLEVYRGEENAIEINPSGFTLTNRSTIQVNKVTMNLIHDTIQICMHILNPTIEV